MSKTVEEILINMRKHEVKFLRLQFIDMFGTTKNVEVPENQFPKALSGEIMFDGSSIHGMTRIEESDMFLEPDLNTFLIFPWEHAKIGKTARIICNVKKTDGTPFEGCPRYQLIRMIEKAKAMGYTMNVGPEPEFFLFKRDEKGEPILTPNDDGGYFDLAPLDAAENVRTEIMITLQEMGFEMEAGHHEVAQGQHEVDFRYDDALTTADNILTFKFVVKKIAAMNGLYASFLPKPIFGINGSGMHLNESLSDLSGKNLFYDPEDEDGLSTLARQYIAGTLKHSKAFVAITNPLINSYKRLVPGHEAPTNIAWSFRNRSPLIRIPATRGAGTRVEVRVPDPAANPYLALLVLLASGLDGIEKKLTPPAPILGQNVFDMDRAERKANHIEELPGTLYLAIKELKKDSILTEALGEHIFTHFYKAKMKEWKRYSSVVHQWELDEYLKLI